MLVRRSPRTEPRVPRPPRLGPAVRRLLARRPWIRRTAIVALSATAGWGAWSALDDVDRARASWTDTRAVLVADGDLDVGDVLTARPVELPIAAVPAGAVDPSAVGADTRVTQRVGDGEPILRLDLAGTPGPSALAPDGTVVVAVFDPLVPTAPLGSTVSVHAEGIVLADRGRVVSVTDVAVLVAVDPAEAPLVSAAAQARTASLAFPS